MKIIHCGDIHLGSKMESKLPSDKVSERRREVLDTYSRMVDYAVKNSIKVIMLCGDIFDSDRPLKADKEFFFSSVKSNPDIDFLYLKGNHDTKTSYEDKPDNLKTFDENWTSYTYGNVVISGTELSDNNSVSFYSTLNLSAQNKNIVMLHGQTATSKGPMNIVLDELNGKNIDYLALGHVHQYTRGNIGKKTEYSYCGCLEGRGFDETGAKGFVLLDADETCIKSEFIPFAHRTIEVIDFDVSSYEDYYSLSKGLENINSISGKSLLRINLVGERHFDVDDLTERVEQKLNSSYYFVSAKDKTTKHYDPKDYENNLSLKGEFIRKVMADDELSEERKQKIIALGLKALGGEKTDL